MSFICLVFRETVGVCYFVVLSKMQYQHKMYYFFLREIPTIFMSQLNISEPLS